MAVPDSFTLVLKNLVDLEATVLSTPSAEESRPVSRLAEPDLALVFRTNDDSNANTKFTADFGAVMDWQAVALILHNIRSTDTVTIEKSDNGTDWTVVVANDPSLAQDSFPNGGEVRNRYLYIASSEQSSRYVRFTVDDMDDHPDGYLEAARLVIGELFTPDLGVDWGMARSVRDRTVYEETPDGSPSIHNRRRSLRLRCSFGDLTEAESDQLIMEMDYALGSGGDVLVIPDPGTPARWWKTVIWGRCVEHDDYPIQFLDSYSHTMIFEERLA